MGHMKKFSAAAAAVFAAFLLCSCTLSPLFTAKTYSEMYFGAPVTVQFDTRRLSKAAYEEIFDGAERIAADIHALTDPENPDSDVTKFNALSEGESVTVDDITADILQTALEWGEKTNGYFNVLIAPVTRLWGFSYDLWDNDDYVFAPPTQAEIDAVLPLLSLENITLDGNLLTKNNFDEVTLDLGGIAKGYAAGKIREYLQEQGVIYGLVSLGSSSMELLKFSESEPWNLGVIHPRGTASTPPLLDIPAENIAVSTSGDYERYYEYGGKRYSHLLDPFTGRPIDDGTMSVAVIGEDSAACDALSTALCAMGWEKAVAFAKTLKGEYDVYIAYEAEGTYHLYANVPASSFRVTDENFLVETE